MSKFHVLSALDYYAENNGLQSTSLFDPREESGGIEVTHTDAAVCPVLLDVFEVNQYAKNQWKKS